MTTSKSPAAAAIRSSIRRALQKRRTSSRRADEALAVAVVYRP